MFPRTHQRLALAVFAAVCLLATAWGVVAHGASGAVAFVPAVIVAGVLHAVVVVNLPLRCPKCSAKVNMRTFAWGNREIDPARAAQDTSTSLSFYRCTACSYEEPGRFL